MKLENYIWIVCESHRIWISNLLVIFGAIIKCIAIESVFFRCLRNENVSRIKMWSISQINIQWWKFDIKWNEEENDDGMTLCEGWEHTNTQNLWIYGIVCLTQTASILSRFYLLKKCSEQCSFVFVNGHWWLLIQIIKWSGTIQQHMTGIYCQKWHFGMSDKLNKCEICNQKTTTT